MVFKLSDDERWFFEELSDLLAAYETLLYVDHNRIMVDIGIRKDGNTIILPDTTIGEKDIKLFIEDNL